MLLNVPVNDYDHIGTSPLVWCDCSRHHIHVIHVHVFFIFSGSLYIRNENYHNGEHIAAYHTTNIMHDVRGMICRNMCTVAYWWSIGLHIEKFWVRAPLATPCCVKEQGTLTPQSTSNTKKEVATSPHG